MIRDSPDPGEHGVVAALDGLTPDTVGHNLVTIDEDRDFDNSDLLANCLDL